MPISTFGDRVRALRESKGWTREALGKKAGVPPSSIADIEDKHRKKSQHAAALAGAFGVTVRELLTGEPGLVPADKPPAPAVSWPFEKTVPIEEINSLGLMERAYFERAMQEVMEVIKTERSRHRRSG